MLPSEALQRDFVLPDMPVEQSAKSDQQTMLSAHGVYLGGVGLLLPRNVINEIVEQNAVCELPNTPSWFSGIISMRGNMVPVFNLAELLNTTSLTKKDTLLVIGQGEEAVAIWIEELPTSKMFSNEQRLTNTPPLPKPLREHVISTYSQDGYIWVDWNVKDFFSSLSRNLY